MSNLVSEMALQDQYNDPGNADQGNHEAVSGSVRWCPIFLVAVLIIFVYLRKFLSVSTPIHNTITNTTHNTIFP